MMPDSQHVAASESAFERLPSAQQQALEAAAFRRLIAHLQEHTEVQNIDLMNTAGFCRNCLSKWLRQAAEGQQ